MLVRCSTGFSSTNGLPHEARFPPPPVHRSTLCHVERPECTAASSFGIESSAVSLSGARGRGCARWISQPDRTSAAQDLWSPHGGAQNSRQFAAVSTRGSTRCADSSHSTRNTEKSSQSTLPCPQADPPIAHIATTPPVVTHSCGHTKHIHPTARTARPPPPPQLRGDDKSAGHLGHRCGRNLDKPMA